MNNKILCLSLAGVATSLMGLAASANAMTPARPAIDDASYTKVATVVVCTRDDRGWHRMNGHRRVTCRPARPGRDWGWHSEGGRSGWWHRREHRWHD